MLSIFISFALGFAAAYALDTLLVWSDRRK